MIDELKSAKKKVGIKECGRAVESGKALKAYAAKDATEKLIKNFVELCDSNHVEVIYIDTMKNLGKACGIDVGASTVVILRDET